MSKESKEARENALYQAFLHLKSVEEWRSFMTDLCTPQEIANLAERWEIAKLLDAEDLSYREISAKTGASTTTVGRVARFLTQESYQGYRLILDRIARKK